LETKNELKKSCPRCNSDQIVKSGKRLRKLGIIQRWRCKICGTSFSNAGYYRGKHELSLVQYAAILYREGYSGEKIESRIKEEFCVTVSRQTILRWVKMLNVQPRIKSSGDQKNKGVRDLIEIGVVTTIRYSDSFHPEKFLMMDNFVANIFGDVLLEKNTVNRQ